MTLASEAVIRMTPQSLFSIALSKEIANRGACHLEAVPLLHKRSSSSLNDNFLYFARKS